MRNITWILCTQYPRFYNILPRTTRWTEAKVCRPADSETISLKEKFEDTKDVTRSYNLKERQYNDWKIEQQDEQRSTKHHTENVRLINTNYIVLWKLGVNVGAPESYIRSCYTSINAGAPEGYNVLT
jgi:hypothetical protein